MHHATVAALTCWSMWELAKAIRNESALAVKVWWHVSTGVTWRWRQVLGVGRMDNEGISKGRGDPG
jgi:hypothetical protein